MNFFLTSYPIDNETGLLSNKNRFKERFLSSLGERAKVVFVASDPDSFSISDLYASDFRNTLEREGVEVESLVVLDNRNKGKAASIFRDCNLVILSGGHTPTQNKFFSSFPLKMLLSRYKGTLLAISAGMMNSGKSVYLMPEERGETKSQECNKIVKGLGLTTLITIPHYREEEDDVLDGINLWREVVYPFFSDRAVMCLPDGSYIYNSQDGEVIAGECWSIYSGKRNRVSRDGEEVFVEKE